MHHSPSRFHCKLEGESHIEAHTFFSLEVEQPHSRGPVSVRRPASLEHTKASHKILAPKMYGEGAMPHFNGCRRHHGRKICQSEGILVLSCKAVV